ncbi:hypothetical protein E3P99_02529 [Wallemia hederae]|uniref:Zn(2)-C6 fungal-type domain-containing protein n=1 Tax=Wallemia hederae TaxID=1540922 RepID=A0A4T0FJV6_9BASI|nr:hypothetical protein E3P99_02529 [Wallemia hederae]
MNTNISVDKKPKILRACDRCRKRKARCDGPQLYPRPCSNCSAGECTYNNPSEKKGYSARYVKDLEAKVAAYESIISNLPESYNTHDSPSSDYSTHQKRKYDGPPIASTSASPMPNPVQPTDNDDLDQDMALRIGCMFVASPDKHKEVSIITKPLLAPNNRRFYGKSSLRGLVERVNLYTGATPETLLSGKRWSYWREDWDKELLPQFAKPEYTPEDFGDEGLMHELINMYFRKVNAAVPILDRRQFLAEIPSRKLEREFGSLLAMVLAVGSQYMKADDDRVLLPGRPQRHFAGHSFYALAKAKMKDFSLAVATLEDIQALILMQTYLKASVYPKSSYNVHSQAVMLAYDTGLHNDWYTYTDTPHQREARRRAIWALYMSDVTAAAALGRNQLLPATSISVALPSAAGFNEQDSKALFSVNYMNKMIELNKLFANVLESVYRPRSNDLENSFSMSLSDIAALNSRLNKWLSDMPDELRDSPNQDDDDEDMLQLKCHLKIGFFVIQIYIYKTFLPNPKIKEESNFCLTSLVICANAARSVISLYKTMIIDRPSEYGICPFDISLWSAFTAILVLIISFCEGRKSGVFNSHDLEYIQVGIKNLRAREPRDMISGRLVDIMLQLVRSADLPIDAAFMRAQTVMVSGCRFTATNGHLPKQEPSFGSAVDELYAQDVAHNDLNLEFPEIVEQTDFDQLTTNFFGGEDLGALMPSLDSGYGDDWSFLLSTVLNGSQ